MANNNKVKRFRKKVKKEARIMGRGAKVLAKAAARKLKKGLAAQIEMHKQQAIKERKAREKIKAAERKAYLREMKKQAAIKGRARARRRAAPTQPLSVGGILGFKPTGVHEAREEVVRPSELRGLAEAFPASHILSGFGQPKKRKKRKTTRKKQPTKKKGKGKGQRKRK